MSKKIIKGNTENEPTITCIINRDSDVTEDIIVEFPEGIDRKPISFMETGLLNADPNVIGYTDYDSGLHKTMISFFGVHKRKYI